MSDKTPEQLARIADIINGIPETATAKQLEVLDTRNPNRDRPRIESSDPTSVIDDEGSSAILKFPHDLPPYYLSFAFAEYRRPSQFEPLKTDGVKDYVSLPLPINLKDTSVLNYADSAGGVIGEAIANLARSTDMNSSNADGFINSLKNRVFSEDGINNAMQGGGAIGIGAALGIGRKLVGDGVVDGTLSVAGLAENPFAAVAFKGPSLKTHQFTWTLSPNKRAESETIKKIINLFKKVAHPELLELGVGGFYKYPWIVMPSFGPSSFAENMYKFKPCVIAAVEADYTPASNGRVAIFGGTDAPVEVSFTISLKEIELWRNGDGKPGSENSLPTVGNGDFNGTEYPTDSITDLGTIDD